MTPPKNRLSNEAVDGAVKAFWQTELNTGARKWNSAATKTKARRKAGLRFLLK
jgi:hypothetical protein